MFCDRFASRIATCQLPFYRRISARNINRGRRLCSPQSRLVAILSLATELWTSTFSRSEIISKIIFGPGQSAGQTAVRDARHTIADAPDSANIVVSVIRPA